MSKQVYINKLLTGFDFNKFKSITSGFIQGKRKEGKMC